jgi:hypothetical protein
MIVTCVHSTVEYKFVSRENHLEHSWTKILLKDFKDFIHIQYKAILKEPTGDSFEG